MHTSKEFPLCRKAEATLTLLLIPEVQQILLLIQFMSLN